MLAPYFLTIDFFASVARGILIPGLLLVFFDSAYYGLSIADLGTSTIILAILTAVMVA